MPYFADRAVSTAIARDIFLLKLGCFFTNRSDFLFRAALGISGVISMTGSNDRYAAVFAFYASGQAPEPRVCVRIPSQR